VGVFEKNVVADLRIRERIGGNRVECMNILMCEVLSFVFCPRSILFAVYQWYLQNHFCYDPLFVIVITIRGDAKRYLHWERATKSYRPNMKDFLGQGVSGLGSEASI
jgi:hypothetical protein